MRLPRPAQRCSRSWGAGLGVGQAQQGPATRPFGVPDACSRLRIPAFKASGQVQDGGSDQRTVDSLMGKLIVPPWDREGGSLATSSHPVGLPCSARVQWHLPLLLLRQGKSLVWKTALTSLGLRLVHATSLFSFGNDAPFSLDSTAWRIEPRWNFGFPLRRAQPSQLYLAALPFSVVERMPAREKGVPSDFDSPFQGLL